MLPDDICDEAERLTRLARDAEQRGDAETPGDDDRLTVSDPDRYRQRRDELLAEHGYVARLRSDDTETQLILHPDDWLDEDGIVVFERVDTDEAVERRLSGTGDGDDWADVEAHNRAVAERVAREHGEPHGYNAARLADFAGNHYVKPIERLTPAERAEFLTDYYPRNGFPDATQRSAVETSVELTVETAANRTGEPTDEE
ncbi:rnhA operon protein [Halobacteriales archaeon SW_6_65_46]|nr:MAG: rnhA operon protein [Halobacteriales archaeon SW_6_65_46]